MANNADMDAFPNSINEDSDGVGLSKREYMATHIMAGFAAADDVSSDQLQVARGAVRWADKLLDALEE